jgi:hypothetical protein
VSLERDKKICGFSLNLSQVQGACGQLLIKALAVGLVAGCLNL